MAKSKLTKTISIALVAASGMLIMAALFVFFISASPGYQSDDGSAAVLKVDEGMSFSALTEELINLGLVGNETVFRLKARLGGYDRQIKAGTYLIESGETVDDLLDKMASGEVAPGLKVTIPEGYNIRQIAIRLEEAGIIDAAVFLAEMKNYNPEGLSLPQADYPAEGFLFPDTYVFEPGVSAKSIASVMNQRFWQIVGDDYAARAQGEGMTLLQAVTLASIIEKEVRHPDERNLVAGVFLRRISIRMPLQSCATIQYLLPEPKEKLTYADLKIKSPYNTYINPGFPPGPIANPGKASLLAAVEPRDEGYLYFVAKKDGTHVFSKTLSEHNAAKNMINSQ